MTEKTSNSLSYSLIRYSEKSVDVLKDTILETADVLGISNNDADKLVKDVLDYYYYRKKTKLSSSMAHSIFQIIVHITQPFRIPAMTLRMDKFIEELSKFTDLKTVLDYGGGGGKDSIIFSKLGYKVSYADLLNDLTPYVEKRFFLRELDVRILDVRYMNDERYDIINCMDVIEHCYDVEYVTADIVSRLKTGGNLLCMPTFINTWDGDHVEKNCAYRVFYKIMLKKIGLELYQHRTNSLIDRIKMFAGKVELYHAIKKVSSSKFIEIERAELRIKLYKMSKRYSFILAMSCFCLYPAVIFFSLPLYISKKGVKLRKDIIAVFYSHIIDSLAVRRLSSHRLEELRKK